MVFVSLVADRDFFLKVYKRSCHRPQLWLSTIFGRVRLDACLVDRWLDNSYSGRSHGTSTCSLDEAGSPSSSTYKNKQTNSYHGDTWFYECVWDSGRDRVVYRDNIDGLAETGDELWVGQECVCGLHGLSCVLWRSSPSNYCSITVHSHILSPGKG